MNNPTLMIWIPVLPLIAAAIVGLFGSKLPRASAHWLTITAVGASFVLSSYVLKATMDGYTFNGNVYTWLSSGDIQFNVGFLIDNLSARLMWVIFWT